MIDFIQFLDYSFDVPLFLKEYKPEQYANIGTGEIKYPIYFKDGPLKLMICKEKQTGKLYLKFNGSIHHYHNYRITGLEYNYNDFNISDIEDTVIFLKKKYHLRNDVRFQNLEFGINITTSLPPKEIIEKCIISLNGKQYAKYNDYNGKGSFLEYNHSSFWIKIYDKGLHQSQNKNILRIEVKFKRNRIISANGISTLCDLYKLKALDALYSKLRGDIEKLIIVDDIAPDGLSEKEKECFEIFTNPKKHQKEIQRISRAALKKKRDKFHSILESKNLNTIHKEILDKMQQKYNSLILVNGFHEIKENQISPKRLTDSTHYISGNRKPYPSYVYELDADHPERKKLRNERSNPRNNLRRSILKLVHKIEKQTSLFPIHQQVQLSDNDKELLNYWKGTEYDVLNLINP